MPSKHLPIAAQAVERQLKALAIFEKAGLHDTFGITVFLQVSQHESITVDALMARLGIKKTDRRNYERTKVWALRLAHGHRGSPGLKLVKASRVAKRGLPGPPAYSFALTAKGRRLMERLNKP